MSLEAIEIIEPGLLTSVQDLGRYGYQRFGVPVSGAMDVFSLRGANLLVGNDEGAAGLEITVLGAKIRFLADTFIAVTGADLSLRLNGQPVPRWQTTKVPEGAILSSEGVRDGMRAYVALRGGIDVPLIMGSRSTYANGGIGGLEGRALRASDTLSTLPVKTDSFPTERGLPDEYELAQYGHEHEIRVILGPQHEAFTRQGIDTLLGSTYVVSTESDRMGYRLEGPPIQHKDGPDIVSDGTPPGAVQVPGDGRPIILLADRGTTGGYAKIATVISADIGKVAQAAPGDEISFRAVNMEEAHAAVREQEAVLAALDPTSVSSLSAGMLSVTLDGQAFEAVNEAGETVSHSQWSGDPGIVSSHKAKVTVDGRTYEFEFEVQQRE